MHYFSNKF